MKLQDEQHIALRNRSIPQAVIIPELAYLDVREAVDWLCRSFGFVERLQISNHRSQLTFGDGALIVIEKQSDPNTPLTDDPLSLTDRHSHRVMVRLADIDKHYEHAKKVGVTIINPPTDYPFGERQYSAEDLGGHRWTFSQTIADVDPSDWGGKLIE